MDKFIVKLMQSVNGISFFTQKEQVRSYFGSDYENSMENRADDKEVKETLNLIEGKIKEIYEKMGKEPDSFMWPDLSPFESDYDRYENFDVEYDKEEQFISLTLDAKKVKTCIVDGNEINLTNIKELLDLADDFVWEKTNTGYTSLSAQISIWCPHGRDEVDSVLFGCPFYYKETNE